MLSRKPSTAAALAALLTGVVAVGLAAAGCGSGDNLDSGLPNTAATATQVSRGRYLVVASGCADCHNRGVNNVSDPHWLAGFIGPAGAGGPGAFNIGPFHTYAANITPDVTEGIGGFTDRQIFNALRYGLDPADTPDVTITSTTPGVGNFPAAPHYLAPPMPWFSIRHFSDSDLWAIVAYLKHGVKPDGNEPPESESPPDHWAGASSDAAVGPGTVPSYPAAGEQFNP